MTELVRRSVPVKRRSWPLMPTSADQRAVAQRLGIAYATVRHHINTAYRKLGVQSAIAAFRKLGWLRPKR